jgi:hypothetical protein
MNKIFIFCLFFLVSCASPKVSRNISQSGVHGGVIYADKDMYVEVINSGDEFTLYFYQEGKEGAELVSTRSLKSLKGTVDPSSTKQNYSLVFYYNKDHLIGVTNWTKLAKEKKCKLSLGFIKDGKRYKFLIQREPCLVAEL